MAGLKKKTRNIIAGRLAGVRDAHLNCKMSVKMKGQVVLVLALKAYGGVEV